MTACRRPLPAWSGSISRLLWRRRRRKRRWLQSLTRSSRTWRTITPCGRTRSRCRSRLWTCFYKTLTQPQAKMRAKRRTVLGKGRSQNSSGRKFSRRDSMWIWRSTMPEWRAFPLIFLLQGWMWTSW